MALPETMARLRQHFVNMAANIRNNWASQDDIGTDTQPFISLPVALGEGKMTPNDMETLTESMYDVQLGKAEASSILSGNSAYVKGGVLVHGNMPVENVPFIVIPTASGGTYPPSGGAFYKFGLQIPAEPNFTPQNIRAGVSIWDVEGTAAGDVTTPLGSISASSNALTISLPERASAVSGFSLFLIPDSGPTLVGAYMTGSMWGYSLDGGNGATTKSWNLSLDGRSIVLNMNSGEASDFNVLIGTYGRITYTPATAAST